MLKGWRRDVALAVQSRTGATPAFFLWIAVALIAVLTAFIFLCVTGYEWFAIEVGSVFAGLIMTGIFAVAALLAIVLCMTARRRARARAILERAARAHAPSTWLDPKILSVGLQVGRTLGWQRIVPVALLGFMVAQWVREYRENEGDHAKKESRSR